MAENKGLLIKGAMTYGFTMGIYWVIKYLFLIFSNSVPGLSFIYIGMTLAVPFIAYYLTKRYRDEIGGSISFFHAWRFGTLLYFFAALIVAVEHFLFFQFFAPKDFIYNAANQLIELMKDSQVNTDVIESITRMNFSPIHMAIQGIFNNIFYGIILSIPVAALLCRNNTTGSIVQENQEEKQ